MSGGKHASPASSIVVDKAGHDAMLAALKEARAALAMMIAPDAIKTTSVLHAWAHAVAAEAKARTAIRLVETGDADV